MNGRYLVDQLIIPLDREYDEWYNKNKLWQIRTLRGVRDRRPKTFTVSLVSIKNSNEYIK